MNASDASEQFDFVREQLDELDSDKALAKASSILFGLGFDAKMQKTVRTPRAMRDVM